MTRVYGVSLGILGAFALAILIIIGTVEVGKLRATKTAIENVTSWCKEAETLFTDDMTCEDIAHVVVTMPRPPAE